MKRRTNCWSNVSSQSGAALPTVLLITFLLVTASVGLITVAASNSKNTSDALTETKAYYAAESGLQAAVNILRNQNVDYRNAVNNNPDPDYSTCGTLSGYQSATWAAPDGRNGYALGAEGGGYRIRVCDPDNSQTSIAFGTDTTDTTGNQTSGFSFTGTAFQSIIRIDNPTPDVANYATLEWIPNSPNPTSALLFSGQPAVTSPLGKFRLTYVGNGAPMKAVYFRINMRLSAPDNPTWVIKGQISSAGAITFTSSAYRMVGSDIWLCGDTSSCPTTAPSMPAKSLAIPAPGGFTEASYAVRLTPKEPQRLVITSKGFGPNGSVKQLESIIHKSFFPMVPPAAGILMRGPNPVFDNGNGRPYYNGCDPDNPTVCVPSIGVSDPSSVGTIITNTNWQSPQGCPTCPNPYPPPAVVGEDLPEWQRTPALMDQQINLWRTVTPPASIIANNGNLNTGQYGNFTNGTGLTFCDGNCTISGDGGGLLIVKGKLTTTGGVRFRGMIVVVGADGVLRNGNGGADDQIIGSLVIAPYILTPAPDGTWLRPEFHVNGGGTSIVTYSGLDYLFDGGITGTTNFVSGIAEK